MDSADILERDLEIRKKDLRCLICCSKQIKDCDYLKKDRNGGIHCQLNKQLGVIFILKNLLQVPSSKLEYFLKECGSPEFWIHVCDKCDLLVGQAKELHCQIVDISKKIKGLQTEITDKIKSTAKVNNSNQGQNYSNRKRNVSKDLRRSVVSVDPSKRKYNHNYIFDEIRKLVKKLEYGSLEDPFADGDRLASNLLTHAQSNVRTCAATTLVLIPGEEGQMDVFPVQIVKTEVEDGKDQTYSNDEEAEDEEKTETSSDDDDDDEEVHVDFIPSSPQSSTSTDSAAEMEMASKSKRRRGLPRGTKRSKKLSIKKEFPGKYQCTECGEPFNVGLKYKRHLANAHGIERISCTEQGCGKSFPSMSEYTRHMVWHTATNRSEFTCEFCRKEFSRKSALLAHRKNLHLSSPGHHKCPVCEKVLKSRDSLAAHRKNVHKIGTHDAPIPKAKFTCHLCDIKLVSKFNLKAHVKVVHERKGMLTCHLCGKELQNKCLQRHILAVHNDEATKQYGDHLKAIKCPVRGCRKDFFDKGKFEEHMKNIHKGDNGDDHDGSSRPFKCTYCGQGFYRMCKLKHHELIHKNEGTNPYCCEFCGKAFSTPTYLRSHLRKIHGEFQRKYGRE